MHPHSVASKIVVTDPAQLAVKTHEEEDRRAAVRVDVDLRDVSRDQLLRLLGRKSFFQTGLKKELLVSRRVDIAQVLSWSINS